jgi:hypothetical protein
MLPQIQAVLDLLAGSAAHLTNANGAGRAFELFIITQIALELHSRGYAVYLLRSDGVAQHPGTIGATFIQRGGAPNGVQPAINGPYGPSSIVVQKQNDFPEWEIWNGIQFIGRSGGAHEFDISIVPKAVGDNLRALPGVGFPLGHGWLELECKDVSAKGGLDEMRAFITRFYDTTHLNWHAAHLGVPGALSRIHSDDYHLPGLGTLSHSFRYENMNIYNGIVRRTDFSAGTDEMSDYYFVRRFRNVAVGSVEITALRREICDWMDRTLPSHL